MSSQGYGIFGHLVGRAFARLPFAKELHVKEASWNRLNPHKRRRRRRAGSLPESNLLPGFPDSLYENVREDVSSYRIPEKRWERKESMKAIAETLVAIQNSAEHSIDCVKIDVYAELGADTATEHQDAFNKISSALQQVQSFLLFYYNQPLMLREWERHNGLMAFIERCAALPALRKLDLEILPYRQLDVGRCFANGNLSPNLTDIHLNGGLFKQDDFRSFMSHAPPGTGRLTMNRVILFGLDGPQALDILRGKCLRSIQVRREVIAEAPGSGVWMLPAREVKGSGRTDIEKYVLGLTYLNPMLY